MNPICILNRRPSLTSALLGALVLCLGGHTASQAAEPLHLHFISGSNEYESEASLKPFQQFLEQNYHVTVTASWVADGAEDLPGIEHIPDADLLVVFARRMKLPEEQMTVIKEHWRQGKPVVGIRTASHAFSREVNQVFDHEVLGGNYQGHFGDSEVRVRNVASAANHPVLAEVKPFTSLKMYKAGRLADDTVVLQTGTIPDGETHPVTWVHEYNGGRMFYTSLGVPRDFESESFRQLLINAISWTAERDREAMKKEEPAGSPIKAEALRK